MHHDSAVNNSIIHCLDLTQGKLHKIDFPLDGDDVETIFLRVTGNCDFCSAIPSGSDTQDGVLWDIMEWSGQKRYWIS